MKNSPKIDQINTVMDMPQVSSLTVGGASTSSQTSRKRRKVLDADDDDQHLQFSAGSSISRRSPIIRLPETTKLSPAAAEARCTSLHTDELPDSCCSSNGSTDESVGFLDLEVESAQVETSTSNCSANQRKNMSLLTSEPRNQTNKSEEIIIMESSAAAEKLKEKNLTTEVNSHRKSSVKKRPSEIELEEFFGAAEKEIQKQFANKYNYDIVNDVPMEGRYEWVKLKP